MSLIAICSAQLSPLVQLPPLCWQMFYCGPLSRAIFRLLFRRGEKQ